MTHINKCPLLSGVLPALYFQYDDGAASCSAHRAASKPIQTFHLRGALSALIFAPSQARHLRSCRGPLAARPFCRARPQAPLSSSNPCRATIRRNTSIRAAYVVAIAAAIRDALRENADLLRPSVIARPRPPPLGLAASPARPPARCSLAIEDLAEHAPYPRLSEMRAADCAGYFIDRSTGLRRHWAHETAAKPPRKARRLLR